MTLDICVERFYFYFFWSACRKIISPSNLNNIISSFTDHIIFVSYNSLKFDYNFRGQGVSCDLVNGSWYVSALNIGPVYDNSLHCSSNAEFTHHVFDLYYLKSLSFYNCFTQNTLTLTTLNWDKLANNLETLEFRSNPGLTGEIPAAFGTLKSLQSLVLLQNGLQGHLPTEMGNLVNLKRLVIAGNRLAGRIPAALGS